MTGGICSRSRVSYLLANSKSVVTESSIDDDDCKFINGTICRSTCENLVKDCQILVNDGPRDSYENLLRGSECTRTETFLRLASEMAHPRLRSSSVWRSTADI